MLAASGTQPQTKTDAPAKTPPPAVTTAPANPGTGQSAAQVLLLPALNTEAPDGKPIGCRNDKYSALSRASHQAMTTTPASKTT